MVQNKIVVRYQDGRLLKGSTTDFFPNKETFHVVPVDAQAGAKPVEVFVRDLKAVFFVKDFIGNPSYNDNKEFPSSKPVVGRKIKVTFKDDEVLIGTTQGYQPGRAGFYVVPADPNSNIDRFYVVTAATREASFL
jgi:hypothetical protein